MNAASNSRVFWGRPSVLVFWSIITAAIAFFLSFELLPLPQGVTPLSVMTFEQGSEPSLQIRLPDNWRSHPERPNELAVYRAQFDDQDRRKETWAVYIPSHSGQVQVTVNGLKLTGGGFFSGELSADQNAPYFAPISPSVMEKKSNTIDITLQPGGLLVGFLSQVYVGPAEQLRGSFDWYYSRAVRLPVLVVFWQLLLAALLFLLWISRRSEKAALYCAIMMLMSSVHGIPVFLPSSIDVSETVTQLGYVMNFWLSVLGLLFVCELTGRHLPLKIRYFLLVPAAATVAFVVLPENLFRYFDLAVVVPFSQIIVVWILFILVRSAIWEKRWDASILLISIIGACALVVHDSLIIMNVLDDSNILHFRTVYILILPALSIVFFQRLTESMNQVDSLVSTLEDRIEQKERQLRETYEQRQVLEGRQALNDERQRIMRDVHDGLGGQLMSIIAMATSRDTKPDAIEESARAALEDLRTMIYSLGINEDITGLLGTFRERAEQQLALQGIELEWNMIEIPPIEGLTPSAALNVMRIMQEAVTNAAKHSGAKGVKIGFRLIAGEVEKLRIEIEDNGCGISQRDTSGHGLENMAQRTAAIDGELEVDPLREGTLVSLTIPTKFKTQSQVKPT
ncbi:MAG: ATP-binding protein [Pseudomonadota bacterium]